VQAVAPMGDTVPKASTEAAAAAQLQQSVTPNTLVMRYGT
jgi:hypothetical protein